MNTTFHMPGVQHAYSSLALSTQGTNLHAQFGHGRLEFQMGCPHALAEAIRTLQRQMIVTPDQINRVCNAARAQATQQETRAA